MAIILNHFPVNISSGFFETSGLSIPTNIATIMVRIARQTTGTPTFWNNVATEVAGNIRVSFDGGANYEHSCGFTANGGIAFTKDASGNVIEAIETTVRCSVGPKVSGRLVKADLTIVNGPLVSQVTLETFTT